MVKSKHARWYVLLIALLIALLVCGFTACGGETSPSDGLRITQRPSNDTAELTDDVIEYALGCTVSGAIWSSSNEAVAIVSDGGKVTLIGEGATVIAAEKDGERDSFVLTVVDKRTDAATVTITERPENDTVYLTAGSVKLTAVCSDGAEVVWSSRNPALATVGEDGTVTLLQRGTVEIVAAKKGNQKIAAVCSLKIIGAAVEELTGISGLPANGNLGIGKSLTLTASGAPLDCEPFETVWSIRDESVATITENGVVTGVAEGNTEVVATVKGTDISVCAQINVLQLRENFEDFSSAVVLGNYIIGSIEICDESGVLNPELIAPSTSTNVRLKIEHTKSSVPHYLAIVFNNLEVGRSYVLSYKLQILSGSHFSQINVFKDSRGYFTSGEQTGTLTQWGGSALRVNGKKYTTSLVTGTNGKKNNTFTGGFIAGEKSVRFLLVCNEAYKIQLDDVNVTEASPVEAIDISAPFTCMGVGDTSQFTTSGTPVFCAQYEVEWSSADPAVASVSTDGTVTGVSKGRTTITARVKETDITATQEVEIVSEIPRGPVETFEEGYVNGTRYTGAWIIESTNGAVALELAQEEGNRRLQAECKTTGENYLQMTVSGLTVGKTYVLSYEMQVVTGYHFSQINVYKSSNGRFVYSAEKGEMAQWGGNALTINGGAYTDDAVVGDARFNNNVYAGSFVAGEENVTFLFVCSAQPYKILLDNLKVQEPSDSVESVTIKDSLTTGQLEVGATAKLTAQGTPSGVDFEIVWSSSNSEIASVSDDGTVTGLKAGSVVITATVKGTQIKATREIDIIAAPEAGLVEDFENGILSGNRYHGRWDIESDNSAIVLELVEENGNCRLQAECTTTGYNCLVMKVSGLSAGKTYLLSFEMQLITGYHFGQINVYKAADGSFMASESKGTLTQWGGNALTINGGAYADDTVVGDARFHNNLFAGSFIAGEESVTFLFVCTAQPYKLLFDNMKVEESVSVSDATVSENFEEGTLTGNSYTGACTLQSDNGAIALELVEENGNRRLQAECTTTGYNCLVITFSGLTAGKVYDFSFNMQVVSGYHFGQINVYQAADGSFAASEEKGTLAQWGGNALTINGAAYSDDIVVGDARFDNNTFAGIFVAGEESVTFYLVCSNQPYKILLDNLTVSERA